MNNLKYDHLKEDLAAYGQANGRGAWQALATASGVHPTVIMRIAAGVTRMPRVETWWALHEAAPADIRPPWSTPEFPRSYPGAEEDPDWRAARAEWASRAPVPPSSVRIPVLDAERIRFPEGSEAGSEAVVLSGEPLEHEYLPMGWVDDASFIVVVTGEAMAPGLPAGAWALVVPSAPLEPGRLCLAWGRDPTGPPLVRRYHRYGETVVLRPDNPAFPELTLDPVRLASTGLCRVTWIRP